MKADLSAPSRAKQGLACILLAAVAVYLLLLCPYGSTVMDEAFFLTVPVRLFRGDALLQHEWHLSQLAGVLTLPFASLYLMIQGNAEGYVMFMRYIGVLMQVGVGIFFYLRFQRFHWLGALTACVCFLLFTPNNTACPLYSSLAIYALIVCCTIVCTAQKSTRLQYTIAGLFYAAGVLCCPYLAFVFFLYLLLVFLKEKLAGKREMEHYPVFSPLCAIYMTLGAAIAAGVFLVYTLSRASLPAILASVSHILNDPEHIYVSMWVKALNFFLGFFFAGPNIPELYCCIGALFLLHCIDRNRQKHDPLYIAAAACITAIILFCQFLHVPCLNQDAWPINNLVMWPINIFALFLVLITNDKTVRLVFHSLWLPGMVFAFCYQMASNQDFYAASAASSVATIGSVLIVVLVLQQQLHMWAAAHPAKLSVCMICLLLSCQICFSIFARCGTFFLQPKVQGDPFVRAEAGPYKGALLSGSLRDKYCRQMENASVLKEQGFRKVLFLSTDNWNYLFDDFDVCTYSAWLSGVNDHTLLRLQAYYTINPEKLPDAVLVEPENREYGEKFCEMMNYRMEEADSYLLLLPNA